MLNSPRNLLLRDANLRPSMSRAVLLHSLKFEWDRGALQWHEVFEAMTASAKSPRMCGIYGIFDPNQPLGERWSAWGDRAQDLVSHRGPEGHR